MTPTSLESEISLMLKAITSIFLLLLALVYNYLRTLDRETLINDIMLLKAVTRGEHIMFQNNGQWITIKNHKKQCYTCTCRDCTECTFEKK